MRITMDILTSGNNLVEVFENKSSKKVIDGDK